MGHNCCDSVVRGYHVYKEVWEASRGEMLSVIYIPTDVGTGFNRTLNLTWVYSSRVD